MSESQTCMRTTERTGENVRKPDMLENNRQDERKRTTDGTREKVRKPDMLENNRQDERKGQKVRHA